MRAGQRGVVAMPVLSACLGALLVLVPGTAMSATAAEAGPAAPSTDLRDDLPGAQQLAAQINAERAARGLPGLAIHRELTTIAQAHSRRMAAAGTIWHDDELFSRDVRTRLGAGALGENVGADGRDGKIESHQMYMDSAPHRANILDPRFTAMGIGVTIVDGVAYSTEDFMQSAPPPPSRPQPAPAPAPAPRAMAAAAPAAPPSPEVTAASAPAGTPEVATPAARIGAAVPSRPTATSPLPEARLATAARPVPVEPPPAPAISVAVAAALALANGLLALSAIGVRQRVVRLARPPAELAEG